MFGGLWTEIYFQKFVWTFEVKFIVEKIVGGLIQIGLEKKSDNCPLLICTSLLFRDTRNIL